MMLSDLFLAELERQDHVPPSVDMLGRELVKQCKTAQETLTSIASLYVKTFYELEAIKEKMRTAER